MDNNKFYKTEKFKQLNTKWQKKLKDSGFQDIEQDEDHLKEWDSYAFKSRYNKHLYSSKEKYYQLAGQFLHAYDFGCKRTKLIWELHSKGMSVYQIAAELKKRRYKVSSKSHAHVVVQNLSKEMLRMYGSEND